MGFDFQVVQDQPVRNVENPTIIRVIGCGGGGSNAVRQMIEDQVTDVDFVVLNTDLQSLDKNPAPTKLPIGQKLTGGLGSGGNPEIGEKAAMEDATAIEQLVEGADMIILTAGMGGGTGTGSIPIVGEIARKSGALTIAVVTTPFSFEGPDRMKNAMQGIEKLKQCVDSLIVIPNEQIFKIIDNDINLRQGFRIADDLLCQGVKGICEIITKEGVVNRDFNDMKTVLKDAGSTLLGVGEGTGENRATDAAQMAISNPMLEHLKIDGAKKLLVCVISSSNIKMNEIREINSLITAAAAKNHHNLWGQIIDETMEDKIRVVVIATGFNDPEKEEEEVAKAAAVVNIQPEEKKDPNVISSAEFEHIINGSSFGTTVSPSVNVNQTSSEPVKGTLGADICGSFESVRPRSTSFEMPSGYDTMDNYIKPACIRQQEKLSRVIDLSDE